MYEWVLRAVVVYSLCAWNIVCVSSSSSSIESEKYMRTLVAEIGSDVEAKKVAKQYAGVILNAGGSLEPSYGFAVVPATIIVELPEGVDIVSLIPNYLFEDKTNG
jgi:hypothetical protein